MLHKLIILLLAVVACGLAAATEVTQQVDFSRYHTTQQLKQKFVDLQEKCSILKVRTIQRDGVSMQVLYVDGGPSKATLLFGEHPRELISPESALGLVEALCGQNKDPEVIARAQRVLTRYSLQIFPNSNERGRMLAERGAYCQRGNGHGIDLNRNWDVAFKTNTGNNQETNPGPNFFSEAETRVLRDTIHDFGTVDVFASVHSGSLGIYSAYAYKMDQDTSHIHGPARDFLSQSKSQMLSTLLNVNKDYCNCDVGPAAVALRYLCPGNCLDYMYEKLKVPYSLALEIYDGSKPDGYKSNKSQSFIETEGDLDMENDFDSQHDHHHDHEGHDHEETVHLQMKQTVKKSGHSCFTSFDDYAPSKAMENEFVNFLEVESQLSPFQQPRNRQYMSCFKQFNPLTAEMYDKTIAHWTGAYLAILERLPEVNTLRKKYHF